MTSLPTITRRTEPVPRHDDPLAQASLCSLCPKLCRPACPVAAGTGREAVQPWRISDAVVRGTASGWSLPLAEQVASCTGCLACAQPCLPGTNLPEESRAARAAAAEAGVPLPAAVALRERVAATGTPRTEPHPRNDADAATVLWLGCPTDGTDVGPAAVALFMAAGERVRCEADGDCCGAVTHDLGLTAETAALASRAAAGLAGAERVVVASPSCARMMREEWPRLGLPAPPVTTAVEWLASVVSSLPLERAEGAVAWHAPCTLTRALGVVEEGPAVLRALGYDVREPAATGLDTRCSGAGAAYPLVDPDGAAAVAAVRREELDVLDAPAVTACASAARALGATDLLVLAAGRLA
jgi:Fe-S oxidoreductase